LELTTPAAAVYEIRPQALRRPEAAEILAALRRTTAAVATVDCRGRRQRLTGLWSAPAGHDPILLPTFAACPVSL
jgi:hypothetical protein